MGDEADAARDAWYATPWGEQQRLLREEPDDVDLQCHPCPHGGVHGGDYCRACEQNTGENEGEAYCRTDHDELRRELYGEEGRTMGEEMAWPADPGSSDDVFDRRPRVPFWADPQGVPDPDEASGEWERSPEFQAALDEARARAHPVQVRDEMADVAAASVLGGPLPATLLDAMRVAAMTGRKVSVMSIYADQGRPLVQWPDAQSMGYPPAKLRQVSGRFSLGPGGTVIDHNEQDRNARTGQGNGANMTIDIRGSKLAAVLAAAGVDRDEVLTELGALLTGGEQEETSGRWPAEPPVGSVLKFEHSFPHRDRGEQGRVEGDRVAYTYLALRVGDGEDAWYTTANRATSKRTMSWPALGKFIGDAAKVELATGWFEIPALVEPEPAAPVSAQDWIAANFGGGGTASGSIEGRSEEELRNGANRMRAAEQL